MKHSSIFHVLSTRLCQCILSVRDIVWEMFNSKRPRKARLELNDFFLHSRCIRNNQRGKPTVRIEARDPPLMLQNSDVWTTLCEIIKKFHTSSVVSFVHKKRVKKWFCGDGNAKERWRIPSEDACERVVVKFCHFWLRYAAPNGFFYVCFDKQCRDFWIWY